MDPQQEFQHFVKNEVHSLKVRILDDVRDFVNGQEDLVLDFHERIRNKGLSIVQEALGQGTQVPQGGSTEMRKRAGKMEEKAYDDVKKIKIEDPSEPIPPNNNNTGVTNSDTPSRRVGAPIRLRMLSDSHVEILKGIVPQVPSLLSENPSAVDDGFDQAYDILSSMHRFRGYTIDRVLFDTELARILGEKQAPAFDVDD